MAGPSSAIVGCVVGVFCLYLVTALVVASFAGHTMWATPAWSVDVEYQLWARPVVLLFGLSGVALALIVPTLPWAVVLAGRALRPASLFSRAFALNLIQTTVFLGVCKAVAGTVPPRPAFVLWQALIAAVGLGLMLRARSWPRARGRDASRILIAGVLVLLIALPAFLWNKTFVEDGSGDGTESFEFSRSLATHQLPYWDLENDYYGFYPSFMLFAYPTHLAFMTIGETEAGQRVPVFFYLFGAYLTLAELIRRRRRRLPWAEIALLCGAAAFFLLYHAFHSTYEIVSDLAEPTGVDVFFTFLGLSACYALLTRQRHWWGLFAVLSCLALAAGLPFVVLFLLLSRSIRQICLRRPPVRSYALDAAAFVIPWAAYQVLVGVYARFHPLGTPKWSLGNLLNQYPLDLNTGTVVPLASAFALSVAIVPFFSLAFVARRDRVGRLLGLTTLGYFLLLVVFGRLNPHYLIPVGLFPAAVLLRGVAARDISRSLRTVTHVAYAVLLLGLTLVTLPRDRTPHTAFREAGAHTLMLYDSYPEVVDAAKLALDFRPDLTFHLPYGMPALQGQPVDIETADDNRFVGYLDRFQTSSQPWGLSHHVWVRYSDRTRVEGRDYQQVLAAPHLLPLRMDGYTRREFPKGWVLFYRPERSIFTQEESGGR